MERVDLARALARGLSEREGASLSGASLLIESDSERFRIRFASWVAGTSEIFLGNPAWSSAERNEAEAIAAQGRAAADSKGWLMIPTGGSSGRLRFARHDGATISAAVNGFSRHFGLKAVNALGVLPLYHVSGLMAWMRCALTGGEYRSLEWKALAGGELPELTSPPEGWVLSLVPTQLERLLARPEGPDWLRQFRIIFLGGAPSWESLLEKAAAASLPLSVGYGMTETAAMVTAVRPDEFGAGDRTSGQAISPAKVSVDENGSIVVASESVFRGYFPEFTAARTFVTGDVGSLDDDGRLRVFGRRDGAIVTGGEKVFPAEVEAALRATGEFLDLAVIGRPHREWGSQVVAAFGPGRPPNLETVRRELDGRLARFKHPKQYVALARWPADASGKINRPELARLVAEKLDRDT